MAKNLKELLKMVLEKKASDLHIGANTPPCLRIDGALAPMTDSPLTEDQAQNLCYEVLTQEQITKFEQELELDFGFAIPNVCRFRGNLFFQHGSVAGVFRQIPFKIPTFEELGLPHLIQELAYKPHGLVLVTGTVGSGKSTTLAAMINAMNEAKPWHIITVEDPIEFVHISKKSVIHQREVGRDTVSFSQGLKYCLREDPNAVMVGEMRDLETVRAALTIAETGNLVLATLHTNTAVESVDRIIDIFPAHQQNQVRSQLSFILQGIFSQKLVPKITKGRVLALEIMVPTPAIRNLIRENKNHQIYAQMQVGQETSGMQTMNQSLAAHVKNKHITKEEACLRSPNLDELKKLIA